MLRGHRNGIRNIRFSPDGASVASTSHDGEVIVWDVAAGRPEHRWQTYEQSWGIGFSPDGTLVHSSGDDATLRTWDRSLSGHLSARHLSVRRRPDRRPRRRLAGRATGGLPLARGRHRTDQLRGHGHRRRDRAGRPSRCTKGSGPRCLAPGRPPLRRLRLLRPVPRARRRPLIDATTGRVLAERRVLEGEIYSLAYVDRQPQPARRRLRGPDRSGGRRVAGPPGRARSRSLRTAAAPTWAARRRSSSRTPPTAPPRPGG